jgi:hypothetical protein
MGKEIGLFFCIARAFGTFGRSGMRDRRHCLYFVAIQYFVNYALGSVLSAELGGIGLAQRMQEQEGHPEKAGQAFGPVGPVWHSRSHSRRNPQIPNSCQDPVTPQIVDPVDRVTRETTLCGSGDIEQGRDAGEEGHQSLGGSCSC